MKRLIVAFLSLVLLASCDKHDPILPGVRTPIFQGKNVTILNTDIEKISDVAYTMPQIECPYTMDSSNTIWDGPRKVFSGFATDNYVAGNSQPVCSGAYVYAGLTTGEVVKINPKNRQIMWIADVYRPSNLTGGASVLDIVAPVIVRDKYVYAGGLGDAFCKINSTSGASVWCTGISVAAPFIIVDDVAFVVGGDKKLYALRLTDGAAYWATTIDKISAPTYSNGIIKVGKQQINAKNGNK